MFFPWKGEANPLSRIFVPQTPSHQFRLRFEAKIIFNTIFITSCIKIVADHGADLTPPPSFSYIWNGSKSFVRLSEPHFFEIDLTLSFPIWRLLVQCTRGVSSANVHTILTHLLIRMRHAHFALKPPMRFKMVVLEWLLSTAS